jgi:UDP-N-acetylglucosamine 2-epimerase
MPEEINRVVADHLSSLLLCPSDTAVQNLTAEGITQNVHQVGDVMLDVLNWAKERADEKESEILRRFGVKKQNYLLATIHRSENTDDLERLADILKAFNSIREPIMFPVHPRSRKVLTEMGFQPEPHLRLIEPVGYVDMVSLTKSARRVLTDSGGLQKEAFWLGVPCFTIRNETEWVETVESGWNVLVGAKLGQLADVVKTFTPPSSKPTLYGDGAAAGKCVNLL